MPLEGHMPEGICDVDCSRLGIKKGERPTRYSSGTRSMHFLYLFANIQETRFRVTKQYIIINKEIIL